ncbi:MAG: T9SS type A sorting domain-containing protein [Calditrichaeota bacterium]|nr:T9SS type A sorting domain-containing protein [Calditrichota bacterium]
MKWVRVTAVLVLGFALFGKFSVQTGYAGFKEHVIDDHFVGAFDLFVADLDGDGDLDLLAAGQDNRQIAWYENDGSGNFYKHTISDQFSGAWCVWGKDINRDGRIDVLGASGALNEIAWWENRSGYFSEHVVDTNLISAESVCAADFTNDGYVDIAAVGTYDSTNAIVWYENRGDNTFRKKTIDPTLTWAHDIFPVDIDQDGRMDVVVAAATQESFVWYRNRGDGSFDKNVFGWNYYGAYSVYAADINGDGYPDVQGAVHSKNEVVWWENDGGSHLITHVIDTDLEDAISVYAADATNDGNVDILATGKNSNTVALYVNDGSEHFTKVIVSNTFGGARSPVVGDFNGDGKTDIAAAALYDGKISWWENTSSIIPPTITVDSPNGGENWLWGTIHTIQWHSTGSISSVNIEYSTDGGGSWKSIASGYSNSGSYSWLVPNDLSDNCWVRVVDASNSSVYDHSDNSFSISALELSGNVFYGNSNTPIPNVTLTMTGTLTKTRQSDADGYFLFDGLQANGNYLISPQKGAQEDIGSTTIEAYDAALAARYSVGLGDLDAFAKLAADVDNDGKILMYDAANIARYSVGLPVPSNVTIGNWIFVPADTEISVTTSNPSSLQFKGIIMGNTSGNWQYPGTSFAKTAQRLDTRSFLDYSFAGDTLTLAVRFPGLNVLSVDLELTFDSNAYRLLTIQNEQNARSFKVFSNVMSNTIRLAGYSPSTIQTDSNYLLLQFKKKNDAFAENRIQINKFLINGNPLGVATLVLDQPPTVPGSFAISKNYPNPFNGTTQFNVTLPGAGQLQVAVYNLLGMKIKDLANRFYPSGKYSFAWDGFDSQDHVVPSGIYVITVRFKNHVYRNKVLFVK